MKKNKLKFIFPIFFKAMIYNSVETPRNNNAFLLYYASPIQQLDLLLTDY
jgi:hypothetical protein